MLIKELTPNWKSGGGVISKIASSGTMPWNNEKYAILLQGVTNEKLDILYALRSNNKIVLDTIDSEEMLDIVCEALQPILTPIWNKLADTYILDYNPIHNYDMTEKEITTTQIDEVRERNDNATSTGSATSNSTATRDVDENTKNQVFGFNSDNPADNSQNTFSNNTNDTASSTQNISNTSESGSDSTMEHNGNQNRDLNRSGNIGVTTTQKMIEEERRLWESNFIEKVLKDVDKYLTIPIY